MPGGFQISAAFRVVVLLNLAVTLIALTLTVADFQNLAWDLYWRLSFQTGSPPGNRAVSVQTLVIIVQVLLQSPSIAFCVVLLTGLVFWQWSRGLMIALAPIVSVVSFILLVRGTTFLNVAFAPVPLLAAAVLFLFLFNPAIVKRFARG